jgi:hypothetical protein
MTPLLTFSTRLKLSLFVYLTFLSCLSARSQHVSNVVLQCGQIAYKLEDGYSYQDLTVGPNHLQVRSCIFSRRTGALVEELIKLSDTSVCYLKYGADRRLIGKGIFSAPRSAFDTARVYTIPDAANDPWGDKGLVKDWQFIGPSYLALKREGLWIEHLPSDEPGAYGIGFYRDGRRVGQWEFGTLIEPAKDVQEVCVKASVRKIYDQNKVLKTTLIPNYVNTSRDSLLGIWYIGQNRRDSSFYLSKVPFEVDHQPSIHFCTSVSYLEDDPILTDHPGSNSFGHWSIHGDILTLESGGVSYHYKIISIYERAMLLVSLDDRPRPKLRPQSY